MGSTNGPRSERSSGSPTKGDKMPPLQIEMNLFDTGDVERALAAPVEAFPVLEEINH